MKYLLIKKKLFNPLRGFSLQELLIAMLVLGIVTTFTLPKILNAQNQGTNKVVLKESIATLQGILNQGIQEGQIKDNNNFQEYFFPRLNATRFCDTDSSTQGCWDTIIQGDYGTSNQEPGVILHSGATIIGLNSTPIGNYNVVIVDANGVKPPNVRGTDQLELWLCTNQQNGCTVFTGPEKAGSIYATNVGNNRVLFYSLFN